MALLELIFAPPSPLSLPPVHPSRRLGSIRERMRLPFMNDQCEQMLKICNEIVRLQVSYDEYLCMKVLLLLSTGNYISFQTAVPLQMFRFPKCFRFRVTDSSL